jgi:hypothetical protein
VSAGTDSEMAAQKEASDALDELEARDAGRALALKHDQWDAAEHVRRNMPAVPNGVRAKLTEKQKLLA